ncbi:MAG: hypothetical protein H8E83_06625 [Planctomycetes bacterium]|nr:hypothetical protein [Planctomycetota bacterium]
MILQSLLLSITLATTPEALLESADTQLSQNNWEEAANTLDEYIRIESTPTSEAMYDRGVAHYNLGEYDIASQAFDNAMASSTDTTLKTYSAFNLGNSIYQQTMTSLEGTGTEAPSNEDIISLEDAKTQIKHSLDSYRSAIKLDSTDMDARANGELAWSMLQQLNQMQEKMEEEQQKQQQDDQQQQEQDEKSADQQKDDQEQKDDGSSEKEQQKQDSEESEENKDGSDSKQNQEKSDSDKQSKDNTESKQNEDDQKSKEQNSEEQGDQNESKKTQDETQDGQQDQQQQQEPSEDGELESIEEEMNESKDQSTSVKDEGERLSEDEANRLLQLIRDKEQQRRKALAARKAANRVPVGKDW